MDHGEKKNRSTNARRHETRFNSKRISKETTRDNKKIQLLRGYKFVHAEQVNVRGDLINNLKSTRACILLINN